MLLYNHNEREKQNKGGEKMPDLMKDFKTLLKADFSQKTVNAYKRGFITFPEALKMLLQGFEDETKKEAIEYWKNENNN